jgi:uncharacterized protein YceK
MKTSLRQLQALPGALRQARATSLRTQTTWRKQVSIVWCAVLLATNTLLCGCAAVGTRVLVGWSDDGFGKPYCATLADVSATPTAFKKDPAAVFYAVPLALIDLPFSVAVDTVCLPVDAGYLCKK